MVSVQCEKSGEKIVDHYLDMWENATSDMVSTCSKEFTAASNHNSVSDMIQSRTRQSETTL
jgi:hypothetical protein